MAYHVTVNRFCRKVLRLRTVQETTDKQTDAQTDRWEMISIAERLI